MAEIFEMYIPSKGTIELNIAEEALFGLLKNKPGVRYTEDYDEWDELTRNIWFSKIILKEVLSENDLGIDNDFIEFLIKDDEELNISSSYWETVFFAVNKPLELRNKLHREYLREIA